MKRFILTVLSLVLVTLSSQASAEQKQRLGDWDVHYMVVNTPFLTPEVAANYGIVRSKYNALINLSVLDAQTGDAQRVSVSGKATNLLGSGHELSFKKVEEGDAIYYLAVLPYRDQETFRFAIDIQHGEKQQTLTFKQKLYVDE
ncbi:DUF4426 domain-containing protein [Alteromonas halophila]|uniref:DUF4426 domain-containing protein n=1 Tax=Alteromonas halophila TaxID=516698 RepID=A0A918JQE7_9ALTE|nr:DUF4426 domain-containing protein [Alteromonas halophila]GGW94475.1 hypothetical protein GCM10007391_30990 [Alteromonas halophila]